MDELLGAAPPAEGSNEPAESSCQSKHALLTPTCAGLSTESCRSRRLMVMKEIKTGPGRTWRGEKKICLAMEKDATAPSHFCLA